MWGPTVDMADQFQTLAEENILACDDRACALLVRHPETFEASGCRPVHLNGHAASETDHMMHNVVRVTHQKFVRDAGGGASALLIC